MSVDLVVKEQLNSGPQLVQSQSGSQSPLVLSKNNVAVGTGPASFVSDMSLSVAAQTGVSAIQTSRQDDQNTRRHLSGNVDGQEVFCLATCGNSFFVSVNNVVRLSISSDGDITFNPKGNLTITGLQQLSGDSVRDIVINKKTAQIGHQ